MRGYFSLLSILLSWVSSSIVLAQPMQGHILNVDDRSPLKGVHVYNIHTQHGIESAEDGGFEIDIEAGHLVEFRKEGYKVLRIRIPNGKLPSYFRVMMQERGTDVIDYVNARGAAPDYKTDSLRYYALYKKSLEFPRLTGIESIQHPFSAMSKKNRQIWAFQDEYRFYQEQKFIDYTFNEKLVTQVTGLSGDSLQRYMQLFRPTYNMLRQMNEYNYYTYIKKTAEAYRRRGERARMAPSRNPN